ncbi:protein belonging to Uncharacterized protein family UPF0371, partial [human gut metagenome]
NYLGSKNPRLHTDEILIALSSTAAHNENAKKAMGELTKLKGCDAHSTVLLSSVDETTFKKLECNLLVSLNMKKMAENIINTNK